MPATLADVVAKSATGHEIPSLSPGRANVGDIERIASVAGGALLAGCGLNCTGVSRLLLTAAGAGLAFRGLSGWCGLYSALGVSTADDRHAPATSVAAGHGVKIEEAVTVAKPPAAVFAFWRKFSNLPRFMDHLKEVRELDRTRSRWVAEGPLGLSVEWDAEVTNERPNELIAWRSLPGSDVDTAGSVHFAPAAGGGTEVRVALKYDPPAGKVGHAVARLFNKDAGQQVVADLGRFKSVMEGGGV